MKMSSRRAGLECGSVTQHRPQNIDPSSSERNQGLGMPLAFGPLALVEGPGLRRAAQTGKSRLVKHPFEHLVAAAHPAVVSDPLARISDGRNQPSISGEPVSALEGTEISHSDQKLGSEDRTHAGHSLARIRASGRAKKRFCSSSSMLSMRFLR